MAAPEQLARHKIDAMLTASGWAVQKYTQYSLTASQCVALCEVSMKRGAAEAEDDGESFDKLQMAKMKEQFAELLKLQQRSRGNLKGMVR